MEVFGLALSPDSSSFDYLKDATKRNINNNNNNNNDTTSNNPNESISFLLDTSAIASQTTTNTNATDLVGDGGSLASTKEQKQGFYSLHDTSRIGNNKNKNKNSNASTSNANRSLSPCSLPSLKAQNEKRPNNTTSHQIKHSSFGRQTINTRRSLPSKKIVTNTLVAPSSARSRGNSNTNGNTTANTKVPQTPGGFWTANTESKTFVNGLLSPFSPLLHSKIHKQKTTLNHNLNNNNNLATIHDDKFESNEHNLNQHQSQTPNGNKSSPNQTIKRQREEFMQYVSLQPCRKVSVVVRVAAVDEDAKRCIFPHFKDEILPSGGDLENASTSFATPKANKYGSTNKNNNLLASPNSHATRLKLTSPTHRRDVVVVNPTAFGKYIPSQVTMETAKLVAQVANIASEDWARLYEFHHVMWPTPTKASSSREGATAEDLASSYNTMDSLSRAAVQDLLAEHKSSMLISLGHESSCFGISTNGEGHSSVGVWPKIMNQCAAMLETKGVVRLTMVEILEPSSGSKSTNNADSFRDLLAPSGQAPKGIHIRHPDMKGAVLEGLCEVEIDSMPALLEALAKSRQRRAQRRKQITKKNGKSSSINANAIANVATATAVIGTLHYWEHAVSFELNKPANATVTCVELVNNNHNNQEALESITHRKSAVSLGQALRQLLLQQVQGTEGLATSEVAPVISYRETTLTKVLQRSMESSKIVLIASISPLSRDYDHTVFTLNYLRRLLVKPGNTLTSPFGGRNNNGGSSYKRTPPNTAKIDNRTNPINNTNGSNANNTSVNRSILSSPEALENKERLKNMTNTNPKLLEQLVSDPRQRLARLFGPSPRKTPQPWSNVLNPIKDIQKSTRGTPAAISLNNHGDTSTLGSNSNTNNSVTANSYAGPEEESRQVVESPGSAQQQGYQPRQSWQQDEEDENGDVETYEIPFEGDDKPEMEDGDDESDEWASEEEIERELLANARRKERSLQTEIETIESDMYSQENLSYEDDEDVEEDGAGEPINEDEDGYEYENENDYVGVEGDLQGDIYYSPEEEDVKDADGQEIALEGSYNDDEDEDIPKFPTNLSNMINDHLDESFAPNENEGVHEDQDDGDDLQQITVETVEDVRSLEEIEDNRQPLFTDEEWHGADDGNDAFAQEGTEGSSLGLIADQNNLHVTESPVPSSPGYLNSNRVEDDSPNQQTNYDLPDSPPPQRETVPQIRVRSGRSSTPDKNLSPQSPASPYQERQRVFNAHTSPYSITLKTSRAREYAEHTAEREELRITVAKLTEDLEKVANDRDSHIQHYETEIQQLYGKLEETEKAKHELETVASKAITARSSSEQEIEAFEEEKEHLQRTVDSLRNDLARMSETHEDQLYRHRAEIDDFHSKLETARETQKEIEDIADEAVTAHKTQVEETKLLNTEREELEITIESLQSTMKSLERDQGNHVTKYQHEIRQLHEKLEETTNDKRSLQQEAADARFQLETQSEKLRLLTRDREELHSTLSSVKTSAKKASGDHNEYLRRFKDEIQQLQTKLDDANSDKLDVKKAADEIRFEKDDMERRVKGLEEELSASRANTLRLEAIQREEQETIRTLNSELRRKDSSKVDMDHIKNELERLKRHKDHLESLVAHRKDENSSTLNQLEEELAAAKRKIRKLKEELSAITTQLSVSRNENRELKEKLRSAHDGNSHLSRQLSERDEALELLQASCDNLKALRSADRDSIARLNDELRNYESAALDIEQLHHKLSRLSQDRDYLQDMMESRKNDYERSMEEKENELSIYAIQVETLKKEMGEVTTSDKRYRKDAEAQLRSLKESESNFIQNLRQRDTKIDQLQNEMDAQRNEINSLRERETSSSHAESEVIRLQKRLANLEATLIVSTKEREEAFEKAKYESRSHKSVLNELKQSRDEVHHCKHAMKGLNEELTQRQEECLKAKERVFQMESTLREFKKGTKERLQTFVGRENDTNSVLERTRNENRGLNSNLRDMNGIVERLRRERDMCFQSLQEGRKNLSELSSRKDSLVHPEDLCSTPSIQRQSRSPRRGRESRPSLPHRVVPEIFVSSYRLGSPTTPAEERAEEIAACVARSAKESLEENFEEVSQLRSQIYRLNVERSDQVASLKAKVNSLEKELTFERFGHRRSIDKENSNEMSSLKAKVMNLEKHLSYDSFGNRTPVMGSSFRGSRKQNNLVDWDEKNGH